MSSFHRVARPSHPVSLFSLPSDPTHGRTMPEGPLDSVPVDSRGAFLEAGRARGPENGFDQGMWRTLNHVWPSKAGYEATPPFPPVAGLSSVDPRPLRCFTRCLPSTRFHAFRERLSRRAKPLRCRVPGEYFRLEIGKSSETPARSLRPRECQRWRMEPWIQDVKLLILRAKSARIPSCFLVSFRFVF